MRAGSARRKSLIEPPKFGVVHGLLKAFLAGFSLSRNGIIRVLLVFIPRWASL